MAAATKSVGKTDFVKSVLNDNPQANSRTVNEAWTAAGMKGTISHTVVSEARKQLGLLGNQSAKAGKAIKAKSGQKVSKTPGHPGKGMFVKEFLHDNPQGNVSAVNEAWRAAGFEGTISLTLVDKMRASLGLTGNIRGNAKTSVAGKKPGRPVGKTTVPHNMPSAGEPRGRNNDLTQALLGLETEIDKLIFRVMSIGDLPQIETALREVRRRVYGALPS